MEAKQERRHADRKKLGIRRMIVIVAAWRKIAMLTGLRGRIRAGVLALFLGGASCAVAGTTTLTAADAFAVPSNVPTTTSFTITRGGDISYDVQLAYHTVDGTAIAGTDYTAASGSITIPAGSTGISIPVGIAANAGENRDFQLLLDSAMALGPPFDFYMVPYWGQPSFGIGSRMATTCDINGDGKPDIAGIPSDPQSRIVIAIINVMAPGDSAPSYGPQQYFATGARPTFVACTDINADGKPDLIVANSDDATISVLLNTTTAGATTPSFASQQVFATGANPQSFSVADINSDGKPDLIVPNQDANSVSVLLNTTAVNATVSTFAPQTAFAVGTSPRAAAVLDVNGDGEPDIVIANTTSNTISVLFSSTAQGAATPSFGTQHAFVIGKGPIALATADIDSDGKRDLITANYGDGTVAVIRNTTPVGATTPSFATPVLLATGVGPTAVTAVDLDGDGKPELIVANADDDDIAVLRNITAPNSAPMFAPPQAYSCGSPPSSVTTADIDSDGMLDIVVDCYGPLVLLAKQWTSAPWSYGAPQTAFRGNVPANLRYDMVSADVNGDGKSDIALLDWGSGQVFVYVNSTAQGAATPTFSGPFAYPTQPYSSSIVAADVNEDGKPDLIVANTGNGGDGNSVSVLLNTTASNAAVPTFAPRQLFGTGIGPSIVAAADINGDGHVDLVVTDSGYSDTGNTFSVLLNTTSPGSAVASFATQQSFTARSELVGLIAADFNSDNMPDIAVESAGDNRLSILLNISLPGSQTLSFAPMQDFNSYGFENFVSADINGDGRPDLIDIDGVQVNALINTTAAGDATLSFTWQPVAGFSSFSVAAADLNGDSMPDVVATDTGDNTVWALINSTVPGSDVASFIGRYYATGAANPRGVVIADVNGDGQPDLIVPGAANLYTSGVISVLLHTNYQTQITGSPATGHILPDPIFADGFGP